MSSNRCEGPEYSKTSMQRTFVRRLALTQIHRHADTISREKEHSALGEKRIWAEAKRVVCTRAHSVYGKCVGLNGSGVSDHGRCEPGSEPATVKIGRDAEKNGAQEKGHNSAENTGTRGFRSEKERGRLGLNHSGSTSQKRSAEQYF